MVDTLKRTPIQSLQNRGSLTVPEEFACGKFFKRALRVLF